MPNWRRREFLAGAAANVAALALNVKAPSARSLEVGDRWTVERAAQWYDHQPWRVGCNYIPASADNELEMWQAATFDPDGIARELGWAAGLGMNALRVFLHDIPWRQDGDHFLRRIDAFLAIADRHQMKTLLVLFDSCWDPFPKAGAQAPPRPGVHNSRWVQCPGANALKNRGDWPRLRSYVTAVVSAFRSDARVLGWDLWNEPDNTNAGSYGDQEPSDKLARVAELLPQVYDWARAAGPEQPLTSGLWQGQWGDLDSLSAIPRTQITRSDVLSFHCYDPAPAFDARVAELRPYGRPLLCTEYMARPLGSTVAQILPLAREDRVAAFNWGLVAGRTQTTLPWDSWQRPRASSQGGFWFHDLFRPDGQPYSQDEVAVFRRETSAASVRSKAQP